MRYIIGQRSINPFRGAVQRSLTRHSNPVRTGGDVFATARLERPSAAPSRGMMFYGDRRSNAVPFGLVGRIGPQPRLDCKEYGGGYPDFIPLETCRLCLPMPTPNNPKAEACSEWGTASPRQMGLRSRGRGRSNAHYDPYFLKNTFQLPGMHCYFYGGQWHCVP
jgi:hypothetical protein